MTEEKKLVPREYKNLFVFEEGIDRTNLQRAELLALLELLYEDLTYEIRRLEGNDPREGLSAPDSISFDKTILDCPEEGQVAQIIFLKQSAVVVSNFYIDLVPIVSRSGYIQSAGQLIFISRWVSLTEQSITDTLSEFCLRQGFHYPLHFYLESENIRQHQKLEPLLIDDKRYHLGSSSFQRGKEAILRNHEKKSQENQLQRRGDGVIFICKDTQKGPSDGSMQDFYPDRNLTEYAICYLSNFKRDNLIHELDSKNEAKPFWAGIFTTPHRLMNAMLNLGKVKKDHVVVDPFCHTGTLAIEASQIGCKVICADIAEIQGAADNYEFLCKGSDNFLRLVNALHGLVKASPDVLKQLNDLASESAVLNVHGIPEIDDRMRIDRIMNRLSGREGDLSRLENRLFFYILRRYELNRKRQFNDEFGESLEMVRQYLGKQTITEQEGDDKLEYYNGYFHFSRQMKAFEAAFKTEGVPIVKATHREFKDLFEDSQYPSTRIGFVSIADSSPDFLERDILQSFDKYGIGKDSLDAVITDPPYGYGEDLKKQQIYDIYRALFEKAFGWLKDGGHLVYCTLDKVRTGRIEGLLFTEDIIKLCNEVAAREKIEFVSHSIYPIRREPSFLFYWKSKWALNRAIVALKISKKSIRNVKGK